MQCYVGSIPSELSKLVKLEKLLIHTNWLSGTLPNEVGATLSELAWVWAGINDLTGPIPASYGQLQSLVM
jgi:hypothetical protein